ncbi:transcription initiation factor IIA subunit 2 [Olea europaea subsp. europaea]|uniref:Transcription initiation factor IIA subunit 2 n=2 Tax=Olea europaea subsp. europaea TaxID=158383 RepID=A0A8S0SEM6_OLEEU|nr:transcription initiation factor IIA subunit 2 [Olea europaea subsp. europaea]
MRENTGIIAFLKLVTIVARLYINTQLQILGYIKPQFFSHSTSSFNSKRILEPIGIKMATFELYRRSTIGMCLTETLDEMVSSGVLSPELAIQVLVQFDKSMTEALENRVKSKVSIKGHLHTYRFCDNVWTFILQDVHLKSEDFQENVGHMKIVACDSKLLTQ